MISIGPGKTCPAPLCYPTALPLVSYPEVRQLSGLNQATKCIVSSGLYSSAFSLLKADAL